MSSFAVSATIKASQSSVWATLADIGTIAEWNPGVVISRVTSDQTEGKGASRYCSCPETPSWRSGLMRVLSLSKDQGTRYQQRLGGTWVRLMVL